MTDRRLVALEDVCVVAAVPQQKHISFSLLFCELFNAAALPEEKPGQFYSLRFRLKAFYTYSQHVSFNC